MKVCLAASAGGHLDQLLRCGDAWRGHDVFFAINDYVLARWLADRYGAPVYVLGESGVRHPLKALWVLVACARLLLKERPTIVMSTGAAHGCLLCLLGKVIGSKVVWIDSVANIGELSASGRIARHFADVFLVQWPELVAKYPGVEYTGELV